MLYTVSVCVFLLHVCMLQRMLSEYWNSTKCISPEMKIYIGSTDDAPYSKMKHTTLYMHIIGTIESLCLCQYKPPDILQLKNC